jgi:hypothetical protein
MEGWHRHSSCHPAASSKTSDRVPRASVNSDQQQLERQFRHGLLTALEAFPKLILADEPHLQALTPQERELSDSSASTSSRIELARLVTRLQSVPG